MPKVELIKGSNIYLTSAQLQHVLQKASNNGREIVTTLMEVFFTRDVLAVFCAMGIRTTHNGTLSCQGRPLP